MFPESCHSRDLFFFKEGYAVGEGFVNLGEGRKATVIKIFNGKIDVLE